MALPHPDRYMLQDVLINVLSSPIKATATVFISSTTPNGQYTFTLHFTAWDLCCRVS